MKEITFIIPIKAKSISDNWEYTSFLLEQAAVSALRIKDAKSNVIVVGHDMPIISKFVERNIRFISVDYDPPNRNATVEQKDADKFFKQMTGLNSLMYSEYHYFMFVDADDLVSNEISRAINNIKDECGVIFKNGYVLDDKELLFWDVRRFHNLCGTCALFKLTESLINSSRQFNCAPDFDKFEMFYFDAGRHPALGLHGHYEESAMKFGFKFYEVHEPKVIYRWNTGDHTNPPRAFRISASKKLRHLLPNRFSAGKRWKAVPLTRSLRQEFGLF